MKRRNKKIFTYFICFALTLFFIACSILLPKLYYMKLDKNSIEKVIILKREHFSFAETLGVGEKTAEVMYSLQFKYNSNKDLKKLMSVDEKDENYKSFIANIKEQIDYAVSLGLLPDITGYNLEKGFLGADLYQINISSDTSDDINNNELKEKQQKNNTVWIAEFSDNKNYYFQLVLDGSLYTIYGASMFCDETEEIWRNEESIYHLFQPDATSVEAYNQTSYEENEKFLQACKTYYQANLVDIEKFGGISPQYYQPADLYINSQPIEIARGLLEEGSVDDITTTSAIKNSRGIEKRGAVMILFPIQWAMSDLMDTMEIKWFAGKQIPSTSLEEAEDIAIG